MVHYHKDDRILSEKEYEEDKDFSWAFGLFFVGAALAGFLALQGVSALEWPKWLRFLVVIFSALATGTLFAIMHRQIRFLLALGFFLGVVGLVGLFVWSLV